MLHSQVRHKGTIATISGNVGTRFKEPEKGWRIANLGASVEATFRIGDRNMRGR
jgi:hypothetical protein